MILKYMMQIFHTGTIFFLFLPKKFKCPLFFENKKKKKEKIYIADEASNCTTKIWLQS